MRGSKQKILKLKEELKETKTQTNNDTKFATKNANPTRNEADKMAILKEGFDTSRRRAEEVLSSDELNLYLKVHGQRASKLYSALSTLIYSSIGLSKADELEQYIKKAATQVPSNLFDLDEWATTITIAKEVRSIDSIAAKEEIDSMKKNVSLFHFIVNNPLKHAREEIQLLRTDVGMQMKVMEQDLAKGKDIIMILSKKLKDLVDASGIEKMKEDNRELRSAYTKEFDRMQHFTDSLIAKQKEDAERQRLQHREVLANMSAAHRSDMKNLKDSIKDIEEENFSKSRALQESVVNLTASLNQTRQDNAALEATVNDLSHELEEALQKLSEAESVVAVLDGNMEAAIAHHKHAYRSLDLSTTAEKVATEAANSAITNMRFNAFEKVVKDLEQIIADKKKLIFDLQGENMLLHERVEQLNYDEDKHSNAMKAINAKLAETENTLNDYKNKSEELEKQIQADATMKEEMIAKVNRLEKELADTQSKLIHLQQSSENTVNNITAQFNEENRLHNELKKHMASLTDSHNELRSQFNRDTDSSNDQIGKLKAALADLVVELQKSTEDAEKMRVENAANALIIEQLKTLSASLETDHVEKTKEIGLLNEKIEQLSNQIDESKRARTNLLVELKAVQETITDLEATNEVLSISVTTKKREIAAVQLKHDSLSSHCDSLKEQLDHSHDENKELHKRVFDLHFKHDLLRDRSDSLAADAEAYRKRIVELEMEAKNWKNQNVANATDFNDKLQHSSTEIDSLKIALEKKSALNEEMVREYEALKVKLAEDKVEMDVLKKKIGADGLEIEDYKRRVIELESEKEYLRHKLDADSQEFDNYTARIAKLELEVSTLKNTIQSSEVQLNQKKERIKSLESEMLRLMDFVNKCDTMTPELSIATRMANDIIANCIAKVVDSCGEIRDNVADPSYELLQIEVNELKSAVSRMAELESQLNASVDEGIEMHKRIVDLHIRNDSIRREKEILADDIDDYRKRIVELETLAKLRLADVEQLKDELVDKNECMAALTSKLDALQLNNAIQATPEHFAAIQFCSSTITTSAINNVLSAMNERLEDTSLNEINILKSVILEKNTICDDQKKAIEALQCQLNEILSNETKMFSELNETKENVKSLEVKLAQAEEKLAEAELELKRMSALDGGSSIAGPSIQSVCSPSAKSSPRTVPPNYNSQIDVLGLLKTELNRQGRLSISSTSTAAVSPRSLDRRRSKSEEPEKSVATLSDRVNSDDPSEVKHGEKKKLDQFAAVVIIHKLVRGFLARCRVSRIVTERAAAEQGVLIAYTGTIQGETGWYKMQDMLFYFCTEKGEYHLICGPISMEMYENARYDLLTLLNYEEDKRFPLCLAIDRLGVHATRFQVETLLQDIQDRDNKIASLIGEAEDAAHLIRQMQEDFVIYRKDHETNAQASYARYQVQIDDLQKKVKEFSESIIHFEKERALLQSQFKNLRQMSAEVGIAPSTVEVRIKALNVGENRRKFNRLTALARGYLGRMRVKKLLLFKLSKQTGVLVAMKNTIQGETGWYVAPDRSIFYFILKNNEWLHAVGPLTEQEFDLSRAQVKQKQRNFHPSVLTPVAFNVVDNSDDVFDYGTLCISNKLEKLYVALPLDILIPSLMSRQGSRLSRSSSINSFSMLGNNVSYGGENTPNNNNNFNTNPNSKNTSAKNNPPINPGNVYINSNAANNMSGRSGKGDELFSPCSSLSHHSSQELSQIEGEEDEFAISSHPVASILKK